MRISHRELETARRNPRGFVSFHNQRRFSGGPTRFGYLQYAVKRYHSSGCDIDAALRYLESAFVRRGFRASVDQYFAYLADYHREFKKTGNTAFIVLERMELEVSNELTVGGRIDRVDLSERGYSVWVFVEHELPQWKSELRFPLIQGFYAKELGSPLSEVSVGVYCFDGALYSCTTYTTEQVAAAYREAEKLGEELTKMSSG